MQQDGHIKINLIGGPRDGLETTAMPTAQYNVPNWPGPHKMEYGDYVYLRTPDNHTCIFAGFQPCNCEECIERRGKLEFEPCDKTQ